MAHLPIEQKPITGKPVCNEPSNDSIVGKDILLKMGGVVEDAEGMVHESALGIHIDEAGNNKWGCKEPTFEHVSMELLALEEVCMVGT